MTSAEVAWAVVALPRSPFHYRRWTVVPNVSWGLGIHECDLLALSGADWAHEIEIKVSKADLKADLEKPHGHDSPKIRCLWFAGPESLKEAFLELAPVRAGIILVKDRGPSHSPWAYIERKAQPRKYSHKFSGKDKEQLLRLGIMRWWARREKP